MAENVLITGASSGIGRELALRFAADRSNVILVARREERLRRLASELEEQYRIQATVLPADLANPSAPEELYRKLSSEGRSVDVLVNNAGFGARGTFADLPIDRQMEMVHVNVLAVTHLARLFLPDMLSRQRGGIMNMASTAAFQPGPGMAVYYASKAYVLSLSEALHEETRGTGVTITCVAPGPTPTEFQEQASAERALVSQLNPTSVDYVAQKAHEGYRAGDSLVVPGVTNKLGAALVRFTPKPVTRRVVRFLNEYKVG